MNRVVEDQALTAALADKVVEGGPDVQFRRSRQRGILRLLQAEGAKRVLIEADEIRAGGQAAGNSFDLFRCVERFGKFPGGDADSHLSFSPCGGLLPAALTPKGFQLR